MLDRRVLVLIVVAVLALGVGATLMSRTGSKPKLSFTESDLQALEGKLQSLEAEDLEGFSSNTASLKFTEQELDQLGLEIDGLSFEDLEGLTSP